MKTKYLIVTALALAVQIIQVSAQWTQCDGIYGGYCPSVAFNGNDILTGTWSTGIHKSDDQGDTWIQTSLNWGPGNAITANSGYIVAGIGRYIYKSTDDGTTWTQTIDIGMSTNVACLASEGTRVYAGVNNYNKGVYYSVNGGSNWIQTGLQKNINAIAIKGDTIFAGDNEFGVFRSFDNGINWSGTGLNDKVVYSLTISGNNVIVGTASHEIYVSTNWGDTFGWVDLPGPDGTVYSLASSEGYVYAGLRDWYSNPMGVLVSQDHGLTWTQTPLNDKHPISLAANGSNVIAGTLYYGAYFSTDNGQTWTQTHLNCREVYSLESINNYLFAGTGTTNWTNTPQAIGGVYISDDCGDSWSFSGLGDRHIFSLEGAANKIFAGTVYFPSPSTAGLMVSDDFGVTWEQTMLNNAPVFSLSASGQNMYAGMYGNGVYYSPDGGTSWWQTQMTTGEVISMYAFSNIALAGRSYDHGIFRTEDLGVTWSNVQNAMSPSCFTQINNVLFCGSNVGIHRSLDNGQTWTSIGFPLAVNSLAVFNDKLFIATHSGIYYSSDQGNTWTEKNQGFNGIPAVTSLMINDIYLYAGTRHYSVWRRPISDIITGIEAPVQVLSLDQNYPNPAISKTRIGFNLLNPGQVKLTLFNMSGHRVASLLDAYTPAGKHFVDFDASGLPAGLYLYRLETENYTYSRRMAIIGK